VPGSLRCAEVLVASNRGPLSYEVGRDGALRDSRGSGGLVPAMAGVADAEWVCAAISDGDRVAAGARPEGRFDGPGTQVRMLTLDPTAFDRAYNVVSNSALWFVHHMLDGAQPPYDAAFRRAWRDYATCNDAFARALAQDAAPGARVVVHDYHLALVPWMLRRRRPDVAIVHVSHTPWAPPEWFATLPDELGRDLLEGMLAADHLAFHSARWADCFAACCRAALGADTGPDFVAHRGRRTTLGVHPLGVDAAALRRHVDSPAVRERVTAMREQHRGRALLVRVDRTEPSKNVVRGLLAYRELLRTRPQWRERVVHLALAYPSRYGLPEYRSHVDVLTALARDIDDELGTPGWRPVVLDVVDDLPRSLAALSIADAVLVNPVRDGMNLVAKEASVVSTSGCALVLSREAGAADELSRDALVVNPFDVTATADALHEALTMPVAERAERCRRLAEVSGALPPRVWFEGLLATLP
jgi:trehalose 6-phosphate synthase